MKDKMNIEESVKRLTYIKEKLKGYDFIENAYINTPTKEDLNLAESIEVLLAELEKYQRKLQVITSFKDSRLPNNVDIVVLTKDDFDRNIEEDYVSKDKIKEELENATQKYNDYKKELKNNPHLSSQTWKHYGEKCMCEELLGIQHNIVTLD